MSAIGAVTRLTLRAENLRWKGGQKGQTGAYTMEDKHSIGDDPDGKQRHLDKKPRGKWRTFGLLESVNVFKCFTPLMVRIRGMCVCVCVMRVLSCNFRRGRRFILVQHLGFSKFGRCRPLPGRSVGERLLD